MSAVRELKFEIVDADPGYVEQKLGAELYMHLRATGTIVAFRRRSLNRAFDLYESVKTEDEQGALGLLVLQRAMLCIEGLGGLLCALDGPSFERLVSYDLGDITAMFARVVADPSLTTRLFRFGTADAIDAEPDLSGEQRSALKRLAAITALHLDADLLTVRGFWEASHEEAKKTMHGVGFLAGRHTIEEPGAGMISRLVSRDQPRPFAVPLTTRVNPLTSQVNTEVGILDLRREAVDRFREAAIAALAATEILANGILRGVETNHAFTLPFLYAEHLSDEDQRVIDELRRQRDDAEDEAQKGVG